MSAKDILANLFSTIYNNEMRNKKECLVYPASSLAGEVLRAMQKKGYIGEFEFVDDGLSGKFRIQLLGRINKCGVVSPKFSFKKDEIDKWERRYLPAINVGFLIVTTSNGVMTHDEVRGMSVGGRLIGYVY